MTITLDYHQYLELMGSVGELQGMCSGLLDYQVPGEVRERCRDRLTSINTQVATFLDSPKDYPHELSLDYSKASTSE